MRATARLAVIALACLLTGSSSSASAVEIMVSTTSDAANGDTSTVAALFANPGPDGISLREAILATNNDPGTYTIRFGEALGGSTILIDASNLPSLKSGGVTVEGDIDGDEGPDVTIRPTEELAQSCCVHGGFQVDSSHNRLHALALEGFDVGVLFQPDYHPVPTHQTYSDNVVDGLVIRGQEGIKLTFRSFDCGLPKPPCETQNVWANTTLTGNTIEAHGGGIKLDLFDTAGDLLTGATLSDNIIRLGTETRPGSGGSAIQIDQGGNSTGDRISDILIARNYIEGVNGDGGIFIAAGLQRSQANTIEGLHIVDNWLHLSRQGDAPCCFGIVLEAGQDTWAANAVPVNYPDFNVLRDVQVARNSVSGALAAGVKIGAGIDAGGSHNRIENVRVEQNMIRSTILGKGVFLWVGQIFPYDGVPASENRISGVKIDANRLTTGKGPPVVGTDSATAGGIVFLGGDNYGRAGTIKNIRIRKNRIATAQAGVRLIGGRGVNAQGNRVTCVRLEENRVTGTRKTVTVTPNLLGASGNIASLRRC